MGAQAGLGLIIQQIYFMWDLGEAEGGADLLSLEELEEMEGSQLVEGVEEEQLHPEDLLEPEDLGKMDLQ